jgi:dolichol-phosphate mannosyltransferase
MNFFNDQSFLKIKEQDAHDATNIAVVIPCYKVSRQVLDVIKAIGNEVCRIYVVDDACPEGSGDVVEDQSTDSRVIVLRHDKNQGVGGAVMTGYRAAIADGAQIIVKVDGDGQMDSSFIPHFIKPILDGKADYTKGNRFMRSNILKIMPKVRLFGNSILSFIIKVTSGYWNIMDPTNGYTAIRKETWEEIELNKISKRFFFEIDMLIHLNIVNSVVQDIPMIPKYGDEESSLSVWKTAIGFPPKLIKRLFKRLFLKYFIYDFNMASLYLIVGVPMFVSSVLLGIYEWVDSISTGQPKSAGTIMLIALPIIVSFQMLFQAVSIDINSIPKKDK